MNTHILKSIIFVLIFSFCCAPVFGAEANNKKVDVKNVKVQNVKKPAPKSNNAKTPIKDNQKAVKVAPPKPVKAEDIIMERVYTDVGEEVKIDLEANPTTGYSWTVSEPEKLNILEIINEQYNASKRSEISEANLTGASGTQTFTFKVIKSGIDVVRFEYARPWQKGQQKTKPSYKAYEVIAE
ncbi:MAG: protease inhibitor I42 family protein [Endomicrobium sp.]|jgi:predicted secreted protein|nr:protease inhibitor I42 family protein [Endomicrobium sp.]